jgi:hypothetical protein
MHALLGILFCAGVVAGLAGIALMLAWFVTGDGGE